MGTFRLGRRKKSKGSSKDSSDTPNSKAGSTKSAPSHHQLQSETFHGRESPLARKSRRINGSGDVGNHTEPILNSNQNAINTDYGINSHKSPVMPDITSIKSQRTSTDRRFFRHRDKGFNDNNYDSDGRNSFQDSMRQKFNSNEPAMLSLPLIKTDTLPAEYSSSPPQSGMSQNNSSFNFPINNDPIAESSPNRHNSKGPGNSNSEIDTPIDVEAHMANTDSTLNKSPLSNLEGNSSGIFSTFLSAAHNAASHIGNIASTKPEEFKSHPPQQQPQTDINNKANEPNGNGEGTSFMQHLDSLLFAHPKQKSRENSAETSQQPPTQDDDRASTKSNAQSLAHDVVFQPVRKNALSTLGKGELTLEALGFTDATLHTDRNSFTSNPQVPVISIDGPDNQSRGLNNNFSSRPREFPDTIISGANGSAMSKVLSGPGALGGNGTDVKGTDESALDSKRSNSPVSAFRRSFSPANIKMAKSTSVIPTQETLGIARRQQQQHRRSISSTTDVAEPIGASTTMANSSGDALMNVHSRETEISSPPSGGTPMSPSFPGDVKDFTYANGKRNKEFHSMFKKVPKVERLLEDYSCALQRDILVQGRMYITERHVCFNANILGWTTSILIPLQEIVQLEKKNTAGLFPNGIVIQTLHQKYVFASFLARDVTFDLITNIWVKLVRGTNGNFDLDVPQEYSQSESVSEFGEYSGHSEDKDNDGYSSEDDYDVDDTDDDSLTHANGSGKAEAGPSKHTPTEPDHQEVQGESKVKDATIDAPLGKTFNALFGDDTAFYKKIIEAQHNKNISSIPKFSKNGDGVSKREYSYTKPLNSPVGPKETSCLVTETIDHKDFKSYTLVTQTTKTPDVPSGNSFTIQTQIYLSWGPKNSTVLSVYSSVQWTAKSWIKGAVEKGAVDGQKESMGVFVDELKSHFSESEPSDANDSAVVSSLPTIGPQTHVPTDNEYKSATGETQICDETFNAPVGTIYTLLFGDDSQYLKSILEAQKNIDITNIPNFTNEGNSKQRKYQYVKPLSGPIGPKQTRCLITETIDHFDINKYILVTQQTSSPDVPSGNSFIVVTKFYFSWAPNNGTRLLVITSINWTGKSWVKGPIEKGTIDGQNDSIGIMNSELKSILSKATTSKKGGKRKTKNKSRSNTVKESPPPIPEPKTMFPFDIVGDLHSPAVYGAMVICIVLWIMIRYLIGAGSPVSTVSIDHVQKIMIDGREYMIMPSVEDSIKRTKLKEETEYEIWEWINERSKADRIKANLKQEQQQNKDHQEQDLNEMIRLAEQHLSVLKAQISKGEVVHPL